MKEFEINKYLKLRLENGKTNIYINDELFTHCKYILLNIPIEKVTSLDEITSLDEAIEQLDKTLERSNKIIPPEVEFWGHCSNLQVWYENNYKTHLLHKDLAFPLLKKLTEVGEVKAKQVFKEEIAKRLESGSLEVIKFLVLEGYTNYLQYEEVILAILRPEEATTIFELNEIIEDIIKKLSEKMEFKEIPNIKLKLTINGEEREAFTFLVENGSVVDIFIPGINDHSFKFYLVEIPEIIGNLKNLKNITLNGSKIKTLPNTLKKLTSLEKLNLSNNKFQFIPDEIKNIKSLKKLNFAWNRIQKISRSLKDLKNLEELDLESNALIKIPKTICEIKSLKKLNLSNNSLNEVPKSINLLKNLRALNLYRNNLTEIPEEIGNLNKLRDLVIARNNLNKLPNAMLKLNQLESITIDKNQKRLNLLDILKTKKIVINVL